MLAARGLEVVGLGPAVAIAVCLAAFNAHAGGTSVAAYSREKAPVFQMLEDMRRSRPDIGVADARDGPPGSV